MDEDLRARVYPKYAWLVDGLAALMLTGALGVALRRWRSLPRGGSAKAADAGTRAPSKEAGTRYKHEEVAV